MPLLDTNSVPYLLYTLVTGWSASLDFTVGPSKLTVEAFVKVSMSDGRLTVI